MEKNKKIEPFMYLTIRHKKTVLKHLKKLNEDYENFNLFVQEHYLIVFEKKE